jgi:phosphoglycolate phosphatase-like HAD superfamily hydrolase
MKLVLFDIDGTVLLSDGAGKRAVRRALTEVYGTAGPENHRFDGKTDPQIVRELMQHEGHEDRHIDGHMSRTLGRYVELLAEELGHPAHRAYVLPGVRELLAALRKRDDVIIGLLTGNVIEGARAKLEAVGIDPAQFVVGAFGSDHEIRSELPAIARQRTLETLGHDVTGPDIIIIGDTPSDVRCGQAVGARAIGVGTGHYSAADLREVGAFAAFDDLSDTDAVVAAILAA